MAGTNRRSRPVAATLLGTLALLAGCAHLPRLHAPWGHKPEPPPVAVAELVVTSAGVTTTAYPQYWQRNTLLLDLHEAAPQGHLIIKPRPGTTWPVRLAVRVTPGSMGVLEIRGAQRVLIPVTEAGRQPVDLELASSVYTMTTPEIVIEWSAR